MEPAGQRQPPGRRSSLTTVAASSPNGQRALICGDEPKTRRLIQKAFEVRGYDVVTASDGREGMRKVYEFNPHVAVLDVTMPCMDGLEMLREIRRDSSLECLYVILLSAKAQDRDIFEGYHAGADMYLTKPFNPGDLFCGCDR